MRSTHVATYQNGARQPLTLLTIGLPGYDETQEGLAVLAEYPTGGLDPRRHRVLAARVVAVGRILDGAGFLEIFESLRAEHRIPARTAWSIAIRVVVGGGSVKDAIYLRGITRILEALAEGESDGQLVARAHAAEFDKDDTLESFMERIKLRDAERIVMGDLDALFLRKRIDRRSASAVVGKSTGCGLRPDAEGSRRNGGERPDVAYARNEQALSGGVPREDPTTVARDA